MVERLERDFDKVKRILVPNLSDWTHGRVLARLAAKYDYEQIGQGRMTNDALIAMSAGRLAIGCSPPMSVTTVGSPNFAHFSGG